MGRRKHSSNFKAQVALAAVRGELTIAEIAQKYSIHPGQVQAWKAEVLSKIEKLFEKGSTDLEKPSTDIAILERKVGQLIIENDFFKKSWVGYVKRKDVK